MNLIINFPDKNINFKAAVNFVLREFYKINLVHAI